MVRRMGTQHSSMRRRVVVCACLLLGIAHCLQGLLVSYRPLAGSIPWSGEEAILGVLECITSCAVGFPGGDGADRSGDGRRAAVTPVNGHATSRRAHTVVDVANHDMEWRRASPRAAVLQAPSPPRARESGRRRRGVPDASGCFLWSYRALFIRELGVREDQTACASMLELPPA